MFSLLFLGLGLSLKVLDFVGVFLSSVNLEILQDSNLLQNLLDEVFDVSLGKSESGGDDDVFGAVQSDHNVGSEISLEVVDLDVGLQVINDFLDINQIVFDGDSEIDGVFDDFLDWWVFAYLPGHGL